MNQLVYEKMLNIGRQLTAQRDINRLLDVIVSEAMAITNCDGGTLYLYEDDQKLHFKIMRTISKGFMRGGAGDPIDLPPVAVEEKNICAYVMIHGQMENIPDVYCSEKFDFSGPRNYDELIGYRTQSMLVIPLEDNKGAHVGVLQLINSMDEVGNVIPFNEEFEWVFYSIAAQAAIAVTNMNYTKEIEELFHSLVEVLTAAVDERSHYSANHTLGVATSTAEFIGFLNDMNRLGETPYRIDGAMAKQIEMAAWLHDVGKIITPLEIMDKSTRLGSADNILEMRFDKIYYMENCRYLSGKMSDEEWSHRAEEVRRSYEFCMKINTGPLTDDDIEKVHKLAQETTVYNGETVYWITPAEETQLSIRYGTLTSEERKIMENHVVITRRLLSKIKFNKAYGDVAMIASSHHERPNGKGYPDGISGDDMPIGARILQLMDIFEALTSNDRPYKKPMSKEAAFKVLSDMAEKDDIDKELLHLLKIKNEVSD